MSKKMMLLALAVAALFVLPSAASAQEIHFRNAATFTGSGPAGFLTAVNEPRISCTETQSANGSFNAGSSTTGEVQLTFRGCTSELLGIKGNCNTTGDVAQTITSSGVFHLITPNTGKPGVLVTPVTTTVVCGAFFRAEVTGNGIIGTITSPACGQVGNKMTVRFESEGGKQKHLEYTGVKYDLSFHTENSAGETNGASGTAALEGLATLTSATAGTLECT